MAAAVLDSHSLLAFFRGEDAAVQVKDLLHKAARADPRPRAPTSATPHENPPINTPTPPH